MHTSSDKIYQVTICISRYWSYYTEFSYTIPNTNILSHRVYVSLHKIYDVKVSQSVSHRTSILVEGCAILMFNVPSFYDSYPF